MRVRSLFLKIHKSPRLNCLRFCSNEDVLFCEQDCSGLIILNRPKLLNAINLKMVRAIKCKLDEWRETRAVVLVKGNGCKGLSSGADVKSVVLAKRKGDECHGPEFFRSAYLLHYYIKHYPVPYIALMDGIVMGHGAGMAVHAKYRICTEKTVFAMPETTIGFFPDAGVSYVLARLQGELGMYFALTGNNIKGADLHRLKIATHFICSEDLEGVEKRLLKCQCPAEITKILKQYAEPEEKRVSFHHDIDNIDYFFAGNRIEEIFNKLEKDGSQWGMRTLFKMKKLCPSSLKIAFKLIRKAACCEMEECLKMDYRLTCRCIEDYDFNEGVRALLIDKDKMPKWHPPCIFGVSDERIDSYFIALKDELDFSEISAKAKT